MKKVKMLVSTAYQGPRKEGEVISVPDDFAARWVKNKIAAYVEEVAEVESEQKSVEGEVVDELESKNAKELYALCKEQGIEVEAKKSKEYYIEQLRK